ncbi:MAG: 2-C-methyl-D-erythritol 4-phosphate cytidylyltransferase [Verrucomicrobiales bacterium]|nr:2-C-methyl-D-erythritol 4-phosphate cytidylyltransferase [Verrucomicrobiales bacterium]|tara:strand:- start:2647 stop:3324 length:678 start_codon:yes stop_codon:yes gene_type:complete
MVTAVIVAAGSSKRMGDDVDKLFLEVQGLPVIGHTWKTFDAHQLVSEIIIVAREEAQGAFDQLAPNLNLQKPYRYVRGGDERQDSVRNGISAVCSESRIIAIHDGARPCVDKETITNTIKAAEEGGAAVAASKIIDSIKLSDGEGRISQNIDRTNLWSVQTPQVFKTDIIVAAMKAVADEGILVTDDTSACELIGQSVVLIESKNPNPKVTTDSDLAFVSFLLKR